MRRWWSWMLVTALGTSAAGCGAPDKIPYVSVRWAVRCPRGTAGCSGVDTYRVEGFTDMLAPDQEASCSLVRRSGGYALNLRLTVGDDWLRLQDVRFGDDLAVTRCSVSLRQGGVNVYQADIGACGPAMPQRSQMGCTDASTNRCQITLLELGEDMARGVKLLRGTLLCYCIEAGNIANPIQRYRDVTGPASPTEMASFHVESCPGGVL